MSTDFISMDHHRPSWKTIAIRALILTVALELVTIALRFGFGLESTRDTASTIGVWTGGIRIHHGYIGLAMVLFALVLLRRWPRAFGFITLIGFALTAIDLVHHFLVLWPITGSPQFDLIYR